MKTFVVVTSPHHGAEQNHVLKNPDAPRDEWVTLCGRGAGVYNRDDFPYSRGTLLNSVYTCGRCRRQIERDGPQSPL